MKIILSPDPILRQRAQECVPGDSSLRKLAKQMARTMYKNDGCGLAGPQVGVLQRIVVVDCDSESYGENPITLVNPELVATEGDPVVDGEGCLSLPGITVPVKRRPWARVKYFDLDGNERFIEGDGLLGRCLQHELDHLEGRTLFESTDPVSRIKALRDYDAALAAGAKPGETSI
ncbi:peptide deformylase [Curtanaerobium respiraculi]|uniref:peptide deformylase n=1 Tax=Curtanaerobium respiraculi TaxID=2949669 RepID=UPI0024B3C605|nr:peptide deformylase [Curtanaerobium respiraculi]